MQHAQFIRNHLLIDKRMHEEKENKALEEEKLKQQNDAIKLFNEIDTNQNNK